MLVQRFRKKTKTWQTFWISLGNVTRVHLPVCLSVCLSAASAAKEQKTINLREDNKKCWTTKVLCQALHSAAAIPGRQAEAEMSSAPPPPQFHRASAPPAASPGGTHASPKDLSLPSWNKGASSTSRLLTLSRSFLFIPKRLQWSSWETGHLVILQTGELMFSSVTGLLCPLDFKTHF